MVFGIFLHSGEAPVHRRAVPRHPARPSGVRSAGGVCSPAFLTGKRPQARAAHIARKQEESGAMVCCQTRQTLRERFFPEGLKFICLLLDRRAAVYTVSGFPAPSSAC